MTNALQVIKSTQFNGIKFDCYAQENDQNDFWATREQIGQLLGYENPSDAIRFIHKRHQERLDKFSTHVQIANPIRGVQNEPPYGNVQTATVYNFKGLLEICRYSNQPKADEVMDFLWEIADEIRKTGAYVTDRALNNPEFIKSLSIRLDMIEAENKRLREQIAKELPCTTAGKIFFGSRHCCTIQEGAQALAQHGFIIGQNRLFERLRSKKLLCSRKGKQWNKPTQRAIEQGLFNLVADLKNRVCVMITPKCLAKVADELTKEQLPIVYLIDRSDMKALMK